MRLIFFARFMVKKVGVSREAARTLRSQNDEKAAFQYKAIPESGLGKSMKSPFMSVGNENLAEIPILLIGMIPEVIPYGRDKI